ncbi:MAG: hypothetical protein IH945_13030 [Armatimonadetes bacterium]|nr:hypothetical protein [Armatimonadota bacterium]
MNMGMICALALLGTGWPNVQSSEPLQDGARDDATQVVSDEEIEKLIDDLQSYSEWNAGINLTPWYREFIVLDEEPQYKGELSDSERPTVYPALRKLIQLGAHALPHLISHLSDDRATKFTFVAGAFSGQLYTESYYDPRSLSPARVPKGIKTPRHWGGAGFGGDGGGGFTEYTVKVGDICYIAVGQIVNRNLGVLVTISNGPTTLNSPIESPALARAVKRDWAGLTPKEHMRQLETDSYSQMLSTYRQLLSKSPLALRRVMYYYPDEGEKVAVRLLGREIYDHRRLWKFVEDDFMKTDDPQEWASDYSTAIGRFGEEQCKAFPHWIRWINWETSTTHTPEDQARASRLLEAVFPEYDRHTPKFVSVVEARAQGELVESLQGFESEAIDRAVQDVFRRARKLSSTDYQVRGFRDWLTMACFERMAGTGFDDEYETYFSERLKELEAETDDTNMWRPYYMGLFKERLERLRALAQA